MKETDEMKKGMIHLSSLGHCVFRMNVGVAWVGTGEPVRVRAPCMVQMNPGDVLLRRARRLDTGVPTGFSDTFGFTKDLRPFFMEWKSATGRPSKEQKQFLNAVHARGAIAGIARSTDEAIAIVSGDAKFELL